MRTSLYGILCIAIRLGAVILAVDTLAAMPTTWEVLHASNARPGYDGVLFGFGGAALFLAVLLWIYPSVIARLAAGRTTEQVFESPLSSGEFQEIALSVVGICFVMSGIAELAGVGARVILDMSANGLSFKEIMSHEVFRIAPPIVKIAAGIALALGARGLVGWFRAMRERGLPQAVERDHA
jgi:hypothetical protein